MNSLDYKEEAGVESKDDYKEESKEDITDSGVKDDSRVGLLEQQTVLFRHSQQQLRLVGDSAAGAGTLERY